MYAIGNATWYYLTCSEWPGPSLIFLGLALTETGADPGRLGVCAPQTAMFPIEVLGSFYKTIKAP